MKTLWYPHRAYYRIDERTVGKKWFWPFQKVTVVKTRIANEPETLLDALACMFIIPFLFYILEPTKEVDVYHEA